MIKRYLVGFYRVYVFLLFLTRETMYTGNNRLTHIDIKWDPVAPLLLISTLFPIPHRYNLKVDFMLCQRDFQSKFSFIGYKTFLVLVLYLCCTLLLAWNLCSVTILFFMVPYSIGMLADCMDKHPSSKLLSHFIFLRWSHHRYLSLSLHRFFSFWYSFEGFVNDSFIF